MAKKNSPFAANFKRLRDKSGLTHEQIAKEIGAKVGTVNSWSKGARGVGAENLAALCRVFKCQPDDLMNDHHVDGKRHERPKRKPVKHPA